jgi:pimeloyl-ACP methyl ester carboxylesterase
MVLAHLDPALRRQASAVDVTVAAGQSVADVAQDIMVDISAPTSSSAIRSAGCSLRKSHSSTMPGSAAWSSSARFPERLRGSPESIGTWPTTSKRGARQRRGGFRRKLFAPGRLSADPHLGARFVADMLDAGTTSVCAALRAIAGWDAADRLSTLNCPAIVLAGDAEPDLDRQALLAQLIRARFEVLGDIGHLAPLQAPADVARGITEMINA